MYQDDIAGVAAESGGDGLQVEYSGNQGERFGRNALASNNLASLYKSQPMQVGF